MFTVRVEHGPSQPGAHNVYACVEYGVTLIENGRRATLKLWKKSVDDEPAEIALANGGAAFIMNDVGQTIDVVRTPKEN